MIQDTASAFHVMVKPTGPLCNLNCRYCFYLEKERLYPGNAGWTMADDVLESYVRQYIECQDAPSVTFAWQGGEPTLLGLGFFRRVADLQRKYSDGKRIENTLQTNGVLLDEPWCRFLAENRFLVGLSLDGPRALHDRLRADKGGKPTFDSVMRGLGLLKKHGVEFNTLTCVQNENCQSPLEVYRFLKEAGSRYLQFIPVVERTTNDGASDRLVLVSPEVTAPAVVAEWSVKPEQFGRFLCKIFDEWVRHDVGRIFVQLFDVALESWFGMVPSLCVFAETCGAAMALEHNGDLYSCDHYVYPENLLGNIVENPLAAMARSERQRQFGLDKREKLPCVCRECEVLFACNGECPKHRFVRSPDGEAGLSYLCAAYRRFFRHIDPYMRFMAGELRQERAPANVMSWVRSQENLANGARHPRRNEACPCGSGRKYKKCCGQNS